MTAGIYRIRNRVDGTAYVGSSKNIELRVRGHINALTSGHSDNRRLQAAWNRYGPRAFAVGILEITSDDNPTLIAAENRWRESIRAQSAGLYNIRMAGVLGRHERRIGVRHAEAELQRERKTVRRRPSRPFEPAPNQVDNLP